MGVSTMFGTGKKQFGNRVSLEVQEINFLGPLKENVNIVYFYENFFHFTKKFLPLLTMHAFFRNILLHQTLSNPHVIFYRYLLIYRTMQIKLTTALLKKPGNLL